MDRRLIYEGVYNRLPKELQNLTQNFEGRERDIVLISSLVVLSNCFPNIYGIYDGDRVYPQLYGVIVAPAASGKGVMNYSRILIEKIHKKIFQESLIELKEIKKSSRKSGNFESTEMRVKILPANISTSEMYSYLGSTNHGLIIIESEADTMSNMLKNDWSNYSDVLRKAFHHEPVSISRKMDKVFENIDEPKLAMLVSGTPDQLQPLIKSKENGLFSRFIVYNFDEISPFKNVFDRNKRNNKAAFENFGEVIYNTYERLAEMESLIEFSFTENQESKFIELIKPIRNDIIENHAEGFISNVHRHGLIFYRLAMILAIIRNLDNIHVNRNLVCSNVDFMLAYHLMTTLLRHSQFTYNTIDNGDLSIQDEELLDKMNDVFSREKLINEGKKMNIPIRTIDDKISQWKRKRIIKKIDRSSYKKTIRQ